MVVTNFFAKAYLKEQIMSNDKLIKIKKEPFAPRSRFMFMLLIAVIVLSMLNCKKKPAPESIETGEGIDTDEVLISVSYADDSFLEKYKTYDSFIDRDEYAHRIAFIPNVPVKDFSWLEVGIDFDEASGGFVYGINKELYKLKELNPQKPLVVSWVEVGIMSAFAYSYRDKDGQKKYFMGQVGNYGGDPEEYNGPDFIITEFFPWIIVTGQYQYTEEWAGGEVTLTLDLAQTSYTLKINDVEYTGAAVIDFGDISAEKDSWYITLEGIKWSYWNDEKSDSHPSDVFLWLEEDNELVFQNHGDPSAPYVIFNEIGDKWVRLTK